MSLKRTSYGLFGITGLLLVVYGWYILLPESIPLGYNPIGIVQIVLMIGTLVSLVLTLKKIRTLSRKTILPYSILVAWHVALILFMAFSLFVWFAFRPV